MHDTIRANTAKGYAADQRYHLRRPLICPSRVLDLGFRELDMIHCSDLEMGEKMATARSKESNSLTHTGGLLRETAGKS